MPLTWAIVTLHLAVESFVVEGPGASGEPQSALHFQLDMPNNQPSSKGHQSE